MAQAQVERKSDDTDTLLVVVRKLRDAQNAPNAQSQADYALQMNQLLTILRDPKPANTDPNFKVYTEAVATLGNGNLADATATLEKAHMTAISSLYTRVKNGENLGGREAQVATMLDAINFDNQNYKGNTVTRLSRLLQGGELNVAPTELDITAGAEALPIFELPLFDLGAIHLLSSSNQQAIVAFNAQTTPTLNVMFGGAGNAQTVLNQMGNAYATLTNYPNDLAKQQAAAQSLFNALNTVPQNSDMRSTTDHPHFVNALNYLGKGMLQAGLNELAQETGFNSVYGSLNNLYVVSVNQRAVAILHSGITVKYEFEKNMEAFQEFMRGAADSRFEPRFLYMALGLNYEYLAMSGQLQQMTIAPGTGAVTAGPITQLTGTGNVVSATPQLGIGTSLWRNPVEIVLHANAGYRQYELGTNLPMADGSKQNITIDNKGAYIGLWGAEMHFPGKEGQRRIIRIERFGAGAVGSPQNALAYITFSGNWKETNRLRLQTFITPQYSYFLQQHRAGADLHPLDFTAQPNNRWSFFAGPGIRYDYDTGNKVTTMEFYGAAGINYARGVALDLRGGYLKETGGDPGQRLKPTPFGGINLTLSPQDWFRTSSSRTITGSVPKKKEVEEQ